MSLTERHRWCLNKILETFSPDLTPESAQSFIRNDSNFQKFNSFFKGDGPGRIFIFFQPDQSESEVMNYIIYKYLTFIFLFFRIGMKVLGPRFYLYLMAVMV